jgi:hypothetical protein
VLAAHYILPINSYSVHATLSKVHDAHVPLFKEFWEHICLDLFPVIIFVLIHCIVVNFLGCLLGSAVLEIP